MNPETPSHAAQADNTARERALIGITAAGAAANLLLLLFKFAAGVGGHSGAMMADAVHSLSDFATDLIVFLCLRLSARPWDADHDYGHGKYETLATSVIGLVLLFVGIGIFWEGAAKIHAFLFLRQPLPAPGRIALVAALVSIAVKEILYRITLAAGLRRNSPTLMANAWHHRSDALSSVGTAVGIGGAIFLGAGWTVLDPVAAVVVSFLIVKMAIKLTVPAVNDLLEKSLPDEIERDILTTIEEEDGVSNPHHLQTRRIGNDYAIDVHIRVDGRMTVAEAHEIMCRVERRLRRKYGPGTQITLHAEPVK